MLSNASVFNEEVAFPDSPLADPPGSPDSPQMLSARVGRLEDDVKDRRTDMKSVARDVAYLRGKVEHLPTTWVLVTTMAASQAALLGLVFAMIKFLVH
jgi:hypothetical protein